MNFNKKIWALIILSSLLRMFVAGSLELGNDEVYYQTYAQHLQWNYFDHPPMVALLIRLTTINLHLNNEFFIRLGPILCAAAGTWLIYIIGSRIGNKRAGWISAVLYNTSFYTSNIAGTFILPDSPEVLFWLLSMYLMIRILESNHADKNRSVFLILLGISIGLCIMSKVHGVFLWLGFGGYLIFKRRDLLKSPLLWISALITLSIIFPIYKWNLENRFITYSYHQGRVYFWGNKIEMDQLLQQFLGSAFYSNPVNFILYILTIVAVFRRRIKNLPKEYPLLLWLSLPLIGVLLWVSLFSQTLPHWSGPGYLSLMLLTSFWLAEIANAHVASRILKTAGWVYFGILTLGTISIRYLPFRIGSSQDKNLGKGDISLDMSGWHEFALRFDSIYRSDIDAGRMKTDATIISDYWFPAAHLDYYYAKPFHHNLLAFGPIQNIHHFAWLNKQRPRLNYGSDAYFIYPTNYYGPPGNTLRSSFEKIDDSLLIPQFRGKIEVRYFVIYRMHQFKGDSLQYLIPGIH